MEQLIDKIKPKKVFMRVIFQAKIQDCDSLISILSRYDVI